MGRVGGAEWGDEALTFRFADAPRRLAGVRLRQHAGIPGDRLDFAYDGRSGAWVLTVPPPPAWRLEYQLDLQHPDGSVETVNDPANPERVGDPFGEKSVVRRPDYRAPGWLDRPPVAGTWRELSVPAPALHAEVHVRLWSPAKPAGERLVVANDGPEYDKLADLGHYSASGVPLGHHLALLAPGHGERDSWYSANPAYAATLAGAVLPRLRLELGLPAGRPVVGMGASLGGLAMLHAQRRFPGAFAGLFLQSGSFFRPRLDPQESGYPFFPRIVRFTGPVVASAFAAHPVPVVLTCGTVEENLANNRAMARALNRQGYPADLFEVPDGHHFTAWRDAFDPPLTVLLRKVWPYA